MWRVLTEADWMRWAVCGVKRVPPLFVTQQLSQWMTSWTNPVNDTIIESGGLGVDTVCNVPADRVTADHCGSCMRSELGRNIYCLRQTCLPGPALFNAWLSHLYIPGMDFDTQESPLRKRACTSPPSTWAKRTWIQRDGSLVKEELWGDLFVSAKSLSGV